MRFNLILMTAVLLGGASAQASDKKLEQQIVRLAQPFLDADRAVGISIGVLRNGQPTTVHLGRTSAKGQRPTDDTIYEIGSVSKVFTGLLLADAVVRGQLKLEQPIQQLVPGKVKVPRWKNRAITLLDLATHRSALPRLPDNMKDVNSDNPYRRYTSKSAYEFLTKHTLRRSPGERYEYSNFGMALAGHLISRKAKLSYDQLLQQRIAKPLGMKSTRVALSADMKRRLATPHTAGGEKTSTWEFADLPGAGGIRSSVHDMLLFAKAQLARPKKPIGKAIELAWKRHTVITSPGPQMGLGWNIFAADRETRWHNGQTGGYHSMLMVNRKTKMVVVLLTNAAVLEHDLLAVDVFRLLGGAKVKPRKFEKSVRVAKKVMQRYVGKYQLAPQFIFTVSLQGDKLMVGLTGQPAFQVYARSKTEWFYKVVKATIKFQVKDGKCTALQLIQNGRTQTAKRIR